MNNEMVFVLEPDVGRVTVEISQAPAEEVDDLAHDLGSRVNLNCAKPSERPQRNLPILQSQCASRDRAEAGKHSIWLYRLYHNSVVDGPGRRSVVQVAGCSIRCPGCYVPQTHERGNGTLVPINAVVKEIVALKDEHDGVTILGGEPFDQPGPVAELVFRLKRDGLYVMIYSGYTIEALIQRKDPNINYILTHIDLLIDGPFVRQLGEGAGEYRGSRNQRIFGNATIG
jgi:anaerobic ribonucleoside-triphosphate reductase activating protein